MSTDEFWDLTLKQFHALCERFIKLEKAKAKYERFLSAMVCAAIYEVNRDHKKRPNPFTAKDFMGEEQKVQTTEEMLRAIKSWHKAFGGE